ncbi:MAG TPA: hypothetical protein VEX37_06645 [Thermomicrobiales bacterium]|nr:hypothetical protein [Thermomicrobiales bacterium]
MLRFLKRSKTNAVDAILLKERRGRGFVHAVGEASYQEELQEVVDQHGGSNADGVKIEVHVALIPEPSNRHDRNAVSIQMEGRKVAYLSREDAIDYQEVIRHLARRKRFGACRAFIFGGSRDKPSYGVFLDLADPDECLDELKRNE